MSLSLGLSDELRPFLGRIPQKQCCVLDESMFVCFGEGDLLCLVEAKILQLSICYLSFCG